MLRFDGKVAVVSGAGRGLGRSHALLLASRGASVVVNDLDGKDGNPADAVVTEILAAGGTAVASHDSVTTGAEGIVKTAVDTFGRLDIVVNNAGINKVGPFGPGVMEGFRQHMEVNFMGSVALTAAAWPHLIQSGAGRVVNTCSPTLVGFEYQTPYVSSKGAIFSFTRTLAMEALKLGIRVNGIAPSAFTRMAAEAELPDKVKEMLAAKLAPEKVSPIVAYLAHEDCAVTGETFLTQGGLVQRFALSMNEGYANPTATPEDIQNHLAIILSDSTSEPISQLGGDGGDLLSMLNKLP